MAVDIVFLIPTTAVSRARLGREYEEMEGDNVSTSLLIISTASLPNVLYDRIMIYLKL